MIKTIRIQNFALIDEIEVDFDKSLNIITGETGAGKSIIIDAIDAAFGSRVSKEVIKTGRDKAFIELYLDIDNEINTQLFEDNGIELENNELIISREITQSSTRSRVNGVLVSQNFVQEIRKDLIDIHSQHETYNCLKPKTHIDLLDNYGDTEHKNLVSIVKTQHQELKSLKNKYDKAVSQNSDFEKQKDYLSFQIDEIEKAQIEDIKEYEELIQQREVLANAEDLKKETFANYTALYGQDGSILDALGDVESNLKKAARFDKSLEEIIEAISSSKITLKEATDDLRNYSENLDTDPETLDKIEDRIDTLDRIKKKYGRTLEDVINKLEEFRKELSSIQITNDSIDKLAIEIESLEKELTNNAKNLSSLRKAMAKELSHLIQQELIKLEMPKAQFSVNIDEYETIQSNGFDNVEFLISANVGEPLKQLAKVASGGEISRVMLSLKTVFTKADNVNTIIFDEIDSGISGKTSQSVAEALTTLAKYHQILCITHQPIIAAMADKYFYIQKQQNETSTGVKVNILDETGKINALASLAGGQVNDETVKFASNLVEQSNNYKLQTTKAN